MLSALGEQMVAQGINAMFMGAFQLATYQPSGATTIALGAAWVAAGAALGAATSGSGPSGGAAARPTPGANGGSGGQSEQSGPTVINVYALNPTAEAGRAIDKASRMRNQRRVGA